MTEKNNTPKSALNDEQAARLEAAQEARTLLNQTGFALSGGPLRHEPILALAEWILSGSDEKAPSIVVNVSAFGVEPEDFEDAHTDEGPSDDELPKTYWCPGCGKEHSIEKLPKGMQRLLADLMSGDDTHGR